ncbi:proteophosphoglycan ppg3 [Angomonas deanei]|uniref:Disease resistance R13L4/SHOC-2-like LRR domain-containing protein n=1 Tax=Angomonas deanei TaxID=59799 RepID=A0A7G2CGN7_9TRYP|nr:proteophosphoglycan ppg3 [Angomonas deanei]CAD2218916.1 hypothetical protein, conserved [Angomonas deanei]|eukprot:EPY23472.1 proteophosphoglycan ppg3 [Angomonas deanei]
MTVALLDRSMITADCKTSTCLEYNKCPANPPESHSISPLPDGDDSSAQSDRSEGDASSSSYHDEGSSSSSSQQSGEKEPEEPIDGNDVCTRKLLNEFMDAFPTLRSIWGISANYCEWPHIVCQRVGPKDHEVRIELSNQGLFGEMPEADDDWGHCSKVVYVDLSNNNVHGDVEEDWEDLTQLRYINLSHTDVDDKLPSDWKHLTNLETLDLSDTKVDHDLPSDWKYLGKLKFLNLSSTKVKGSLPSKWMTMYSLEELYINDAKLEKSLPNWYGSSMPKLRVVELRNNNFEGRLAESWSTLNLETLKIDGNKWCGCVPPSWANSPVLSEAAAFPGSTLLNPTCHTDKCKKA